MPSVGFEPSSHQASGHRPTPYTARPMGSAVVIIIMIIMWYETAEAQYEVCLFRLGLQLDYHFFLKPRMCFQKSNIYNALIKSSLLYGSETWRLKADSHIACRAYAVPLPCLAVPCRAVPCR